LADDGSGQQTHRVRAAPVTEATIIDAVSGEMSHYRSCSYIAALASIRWDDRPRKRMCFLAEQTYARCVRTLYD
jgi:hypothetical protein